MPCNRREAWGTLLWEETHELCFTNINWQTRQNNLTAEQCKTKRLQETSPKTGDIQLPWSWQWDDRMLVILLIKITMTMMAKPLMMKIMNDTEKCHMRFSRILGTVEYVSDFELTTQMKSKAATTCLVCESVEIKAEWCRLRLSFASFFIAQQCHNWVLSVSVCVLRYLLSIIYLASLRCFTSYHSTIRLCNIATSVIHYTIPVVTTSLLSFLIFSKSNACSRTRQVDSAASKHRSSRTISMSQPQHRRLERQHQVCHAVHAEQSSENDERCPKTAEWWTLYLFSANVIHKCRIFLCHVSLAESKQYGRSDSVQLCWGIVEAKVRQHSLPHGKTVQVCGTLASPASPQMQQVWLQNVQLKGTEMGASERAPGSAAWNSRKIQNKFVSCKFPW